MKPTPARARFFTPNWLATLPLLTSVAVWIHLGALPMGPAAAATTTGSTSATVITPVSVNVQDTFSGTVPAAISTSTGWVTVLLPPASPPPGASTGSGPGSTGGGGGGSASAVTAAAGAGNASGASQSNRPGSGPGAGDGTLGGGMAASLSSSPPPAGGDSGNYNVTVAFN